MEIDPSADARPLLQSMLEPVKGQLRCSPEHNLIVASPYLTSTIAEDLLKNIAPSTVKVLTTFRAENFASGASSLVTLRRLLLAGFQLSHFDSLHAKVVSSETFCSIGSQNLTEGGRQNREASVLITEQTRAAEVRSGLIAWLRSSLPITLAMVDDMEKQIEPLLEKVKELQTTLGDIDSSVRAAEALRAKRLHRESEEKERRERQALLEQTADVYSTLRSAVRSAPASSRAFLTLQHLTNDTWSSWSSHYTLLASPSANLTEWMVDGASEILTKRQRYLLIAPETGKLGWPALNKTRLTRFGMDLTPHSEHVRLGTHLLKVEEITFNRSLATLKDWNVKFHVSRHNDSCMLFMRFTLEGLELERLEIGTSRHSQEFESIISTNTSRLSSQLRRTLTDSFRYKSNSRGIDAQEFCDGLESRLVLRLRTYGLRRFLSLESR